MRSKIILSILGLVALGILAAFLFGLSRQFVPAEPSVAPPSRIIMEKVTFKTEDGVDIAADFYPAKEPSARGVLLVHMMPATRVSWKDFAPKLQEAGFSVLAIDLRGHGESTGGPKGYQRFSDAEHQKSILDLRAGAKFLEEKGVRSQELALVGASIGANLALQFMSLNHEVRKGALLSPGFNYRGIETQPLMAKLKAGQRVLLVGSDDDSQSSSQVMRTLVSKAPSGVETKAVVYRTAGHGTDMFGKETPDLAQEILNWLK